MSCMRSTERMFVSVSLAVLATRSAQSRKISNCSYVIVLEFFHVFPVAQDGERYVVVVTSRGVLPRFGFTCIGFLDVFEAVNKFFVHVLEILS